MPTETFTQYVFIDFENVPSLDLGLIEGKSVHVTLLIGKSSAPFADSCEIPTDLKVTYREAS